MSWSKEGEGMDRLMVKGERASGHSPGLGSIPALSQNTEKGPSLSLSHTQHPQSRQFCPSWLAHHEHSHGLKGHHPPKSTLSP